MSLPCQRRRTLWKLVRKITGSNRKQKLCFILSVLFVLVYLSYQPSASVWNENGKQKFLISSDIEGKSGHDLFMSCKIPVLRPDDPYMVGANTAQATLYSRTKNKLRCVGQNDGAMSKFAIDLNLRLVRLKKGPNDNDIDCFYQGYHRIPDSPDYSYAYSDIYKVESDVTDLWGSEEDFFLIWCHPQKYTQLYGPHKNSSHLLYEDHLAHVPIKSTVIKERLNEGRKWKEKQERLHPSSKQRNQSKSAKSTQMSILILGMDTFSRMNFLRTMPKSHNFLVQEMKAMEFQGFNSLGRDSWDNIIPFLTGEGQWDLFNHHCPWFPVIVDRVLTSKPIDACPFIWKEFQKRGYITGFLDEDRRNGIKPFRKATVGSVDLLRTKSRNKVHIKM